MTTSDHEVVVVGGRCAGSATARLLALRGHDVAVVERASYASDTLSTHGLARGAVTQLARWGLLDEVLATGTPAVREVTFAVDGGETTRELKHRAGVDLLVAPRRFVLDTLLADSAVAAGATVWTRTPATGLLRDDTGRVTGVEARTRAGQELTLHARHVIGADGVGSATARWVRARTVRSSTTDASTYYLYADGVSWRGFEFHVGAQAYGGVFPTNDGQGCVWLCRPTPLLEPVRRAGANRVTAFLAALAETAPSLAERVQEGRVVSRVRGRPAPANFVRAPHGPGWSLVGDAASHRDPITGHGITDALRDAELLAEAVHRALSEPGREREAFSAYRAASHAALGPVLDLTERLARFPDTTRFVELQIRLAEALDREASEIASRPAPPVHRAATAA